MGFRHRLTRPVLLAVFIAANLASALPLVYCLAPGGHHAVELAHGTSHYGADARATRSEASARHSGTAVTVVHGCVDVAMLSSADPSSRAMDGGSHKRAPLPQPPVLASASVLAAPLQEGPIARNYPPAPDLALVARRTVVLLI